MTGTEPGRVCAGCKRNMRSRLGGVFSYGGAYWHLLCFYKASDEERAAARRAQADLTAMAALSSRAHEEPSIPCASGPDSDVSSGRGDRLEAQHLCPGTARSEPRPSSPLGTVGRVARGTLRPLPQFLPEVAVRDPGPGRHDLEWRRSLNHAPADEAERIEMERWKT